MRFAESTQSLQDIRVYTMVVNLSNWADKCTMPGYSTPYKYYLDHKEKVHMGLNVLQVILKNKQVNS